ncbi:cytokinin riboside 5'-monophosphate phosphoribohydrolase [Enterococcus florum]|uniref:Cytokinin riboside 5'-monophosphate phosphoribohydrolase n=1 Tax=Enterococcus florum TaxID=2480627 RepID=A0A4P5P7E8_9ENTE|nr:TIGR00730 family Rossman fold protein [Enterococcus florum]GCF93905.1 cytokinin riboside 5'-monophosphate phosphoribohydrolase [Enterococcus florum]
MIIAVYCGASAGDDPIYTENTRALGTWIATNNHQLIYGGGKAGLMGVLADTVLENGGKVVGVIPSFLQARELAHPDLDELIVVDTMSQRKNQMIAAADVCIALPGGPGTLEEISEAISWARVGQNDSPCIFYDTNEYYLPLQHFFDQMVATSFLSAEDRSKIGFAHSIEEIEQLITNYTPPKV